MNEEKEFYSGEKVYVQNSVNKKWLPGVIVNKTDFSRSFIVKNQNG